MFTKFVFIRRVFPIFILALMIPVRGYSLDDNPISPEELSSMHALFRKTRDAFYNAPAASFPHVLDLAGEAKRRCAGWQDGFQKSYWQTQFVFLTGQIAEAANDNNLAVRIYSESMCLAEKTLELDPGSSEAHSLLADTYARAMNVNNFIFKIMKGPEGYTHINKALEIDPDNYPAWNLLSGYYLNVPEAFGGNVDKAINAARSALESAEPFDHFISYVWLGQAYTRKKMNREAMENFRKALAIYPENEWVQSFVRNIGE